MTVQVVHEITEREDYTPEVACTMLSSLGELSDGSAEVTEMVDIIVLRHQSNLQVQLAAIRFLLQSDLAGEAEVRIKTALDSVSSSAHLYSPDMLRQLHGLFWSWAFRHFEVGKKGIA